MTTSPNPQDDKELTILAAKAAGIDHPGGDHSRYDDGRLWDCEGLRWWNPLADDGDALRLAVRLGIHFCALEHSAIASRSEDELFVQVAFEDEGYAATRRAIVRAAAEIVRQESSHDS